MANLHAKPTIASITHANKTQLDGCKANATTVIAVEDSSRFKLR